MHTLIYMGILEYQIKVRLIYKVEGDNGHTCSAHLSPPPPAKIRLAPPPTQRSLRRRSSPASSNIFDSSLLLHGCHVSPTDFDIHILEIWPCPTVSSNDMNPSSINSSSSLSQNKQLKNYKFSITINFLYFKNYIRIYEIYIYDNT